MQVNTTFEDYKDKDKHYTWKEVKNKEGIYMPLTAANCRLITFRYYNEYITLYLGQNFMYIATNWDDHIFREMAETLEIKVVGAGKK